MRKKLIILLGRERSGTTVIESCLDSHPAVCGFGECFFPEESPSHLVGYYQFLTKRILLDPRMAIRDKHEPHIIRDYLDAIAGAAPYKAVTVVSLKYHQVFINPHLEETIRDLRLPVLHVVRRNFLETYVSHLQMNERLRRNTPIHGHRKADDPPVELDCTILAAELQAREQEVDMVASRFQASLFASLFYEEDLQVWDDGTTGLTTEAAERVCAGMGVAPCRLSSRLVKQGSLNLPDRIINYAEVANTLRDTAYAGLLPGTADDPPGETPVSL